MTAAAPASAKLIRRRRAIGLLAIRAIAGRHAEHKDKVAAAEKSKDVQEALGEFIREKADADGRPVLTWIIAHLPEILAFFLTLIA